MTWHDEIPLALSYDDVMLVPQRSRILSRRDVDTTTAFTRRIQLAVPLVSANMDTVTESTMAIAMARVGGIGVIHRFLTVQQQAREVARVKRAEALVIEDPHTVTPGTSLDRAGAMMRDLGVSGLVVVEGDRLVGMLTNRDLQMSVHGGTVAHAMTPRERLVVGGPDTPSEDALRTMRDARVEKLPLVAEDDRLVGLVTMKDLLRHSARREATIDARGRLRKRSPAMAAGLTDHVWSLREWLTYPAKPCSPVSATTKR